MSNNLQVQAQLGAQLVSSLDKILEDSGSINRLLEGQLDISSQLNTAVERFSDNFVKLSKDLGDVSKSFEEAITSGQLDNNFSRQTRTLDKAAKKACDNIDESASTLEQVVNDQDKITSARERRTKDLKKAYGQRIIAHKENNFILRSLDRAFVGVTETMDELIDKFKNMPIVTRAASTMGWSLLVDIPRMIIVNVFKVIGSLIGAATTFFKTVIALPLMLANSAVKIGNAFRQDIIETIGNAYQATKEYSDANSLIGKGMSNLRNMAVGSLKVFENPRSTMVKLFGSGVGGAQKFLTDVAKSIDDMGPLAELFGHQVSNSMESAQFLVYATKGLGLTSKDVAYYALDAGVHVENIFDRLERSAETVKHAAKTHGVDTKAVSIGMQKLRSNIKDFGHLSDQNLSNLVARMRQLNVGAEDLVNVFGKFKSLEDASKTSAMLYQSFQMNIDALSLLTAKDPGEIVEQFRDAMFATGRAYDDLNRHEKQLMQQTTGMTDAMLKSLMTYQNMGLSYEEAKQRVANDDPTKKQIEAIKGLTSSISEIQKVMTFNSPFEAFMAGLGKNAASSKKARKIATALSKVYETIYLLGLNIDKNTIKAITTPVILILNKINEVFKGGTLNNLLQGTTIFTNVLSSVTGGLTKKGGYNNASKTLDNVFAMQKSGMSNVKKDLTSVRKKVQKLVKAGDPEVIKYLQSRNIIDDDKNFIKDLTLNSVLKQLKQASLHMSSAKGKESIKKINDEIYDHTAKLLDNYIGVKSFEDNRGLRGQINQTTEGFKNMFKEGGGPLKTMFDIGRKMMGGIVKGAAIALTVFLHMLNGTIDQAFDNMSSPIANTLRNSLGYKEGEKFTLLNWLGISKKDNNDIVDELAKSLGKLTTKSWKVLKIGGFFLTKLLSTFKILATGMIYGIAKAFIAFADRDDLTTSQRLMIAWFVDPKDLNKARGMSQVGSLGLDFSEMSSKLNDKRLKADDLKLEERRLSFNSNAMEIIWDRLTEKYGKKPGIYNDVLKQNSIISTKGDNITFKDAIEMLRVSKNLNALESFLSYEEYLKIPNKNKRLTDKDLKKRLDIYKRKNKLSTSREFLSSVYTDWYKSSGKLLQRGWQNFSLNYNFTNSYASALDKILSIAFKKVSSTRPPSNLTANDYLKNKKFDQIKDGVLEGKLNSILSQNGLKLFTSDGKVIVPHSMDELVNLSGDDKEGLVNVFQNVGVAYREVATAVTTIKRQGLGFNREEYGASDELIDELMSLVYETLQISINRDIEIKQTGVRKV